jgi:hypothetical protein
MTSIGHTQGIINEDGEIQEICVRFNQKNGIAWYKGYLFDTDYQKEEDVGTVIVESFIGLGDSSVSDNAFKKYCKRYEYDTGSYTVSIHINGHDEVFRGIQYRKPWVEIN